jgi:hypothetical protein
MVINMTAPLAFDTGFPDRNEATKVREYIAETLGAVSFYAAHGREYAEFGQDAMMQLSIHHAVCCLKAVIETLEDLKKLNLQGGNQDRSKKSPM